MVVTRNSQRSPERSEVTSINKLLAKRKEEKRKKKSAKFVDKETTSNVGDKVKEGKIIAHGGHEGFCPVFVNKITGITKVHYEEPEKEGPKFNYFCPVYLHFLCYFTYYFTLLVILYVF